MPKRNMFEDDALEDFAARQITLDDVTKVVHVAGSGPAVIVIAFVRTNRFGASNTTHCEYTVRPAICGSLGNGFHWTVALPRASTTWNACMSMFA